MIGSNFPLVCMPLFRGLLGVERKCFAVWGGFHPPLSHITLIPDLTLARSDLCMSTVPEYAGSHL